MMSSQSCSCDASSGASYYSTGKERTMSRPSRARNAAVYKNLQKGSLIEIDRGRYKHLAVFLGENDLVIHVIRQTETNYCTCSNRNISLGEPNVTSCCTGCGLPYQYSVVYGHFWTVVGAGIVKEFKTKERPLPPDVIVQRAKSKLGPVNYNLIERNCEHFATWCVCNAPYSNQTGFTWNNASTYLAKFKSAFAK